MLRIEKLQVLGFKSFCDRTEVRLTGGITAVVGPNGCGKSNIGDAIHWVLGEQSARTLRGERMEDVIFAGSEVRKPLGMAEVTLKLTGFGTLPGGRDSVEISRRLYRSGESDYLIDGQKSRLKDIQDLLAQAHVGARTSAVIEQGKVEALLTARPKDRRLIVEDAAGIIGYKQKRRLSETRLEAVEANLLRVSDIISEVERQIRSLKRQAANARRHRRLLDEAHALQRALYAHQAARLEAELAAVSARVREAADRETSESAVLARLEAASGAGRLHLEEMEPALAALREQLHRTEVAIEREINRREGAIQRRAETEQQIARLAGDVADHSARSDALAGQTSERRSQRDQAASALEAARSRRRDLETSHAERSALSTGLQERIERSRQEALAARERLIETRNALRRGEEERYRAEARLSRLDEDIEAARAERERQAAAREEARSARTEMESALARIAAEEAERNRDRQAAAERAGGLGSRSEEAQKLLAGQKERLRTLADVSTRFAGRNEGVGFILTRAAEEGIAARGVVADYLRAGLEVERAAEGYLSELLPAVVVEGREDIVRGIAALRREGAGRCLFLAERNGHGAPSEREPIPETLGSEAGVLGALSGRIEAAAPYNGLITDRFDEAVLVDTLPRALELHERYPRHNFVTPEGDVVFATGLVAGGRSTRAGEGLLAQARTIETARAETAARAREAGRLELELAEAQAALRETQERCSDLAAGRSQAEKSLLGARLREERCEEELERAHRAVLVLETERVQAGREASELAAELEGLRGELGRLETDLAALEEAVGISEREIRSMSESLLAGGQELGALRSEEATLAERLDGLDRELAGLAETASEIAERMRQSSEGMRQAALRARELEQEAGQAAARIGELEGARRADRAAIAEAEERAAGLREEVAAREAEARDARGRLEALRADRQRSEVEAARLASDRDHLARRCREDLGQTLEDVVSRAAAIRDEEAAAVGENAGSFDPAAAEERIAQVRRKIEGLGPVNQMALDQFVELEERFKFLTGQRQDLVASIESLRESIRKINRSSRERFIEAFEQIRGNFNEIFRLLFGGGRADLCLEEAEDPLEAGLEVIAQPPGKRLQSISLLSGGEKAMTAIALLFAVFRYQPSPFCLMDEVDAALDEVNVGRFTRMLQEYSRETQFIVVTHNPRSMEAADVLYGVTMPEPGISHVVSMRLPEAVAHAG